MEDISLLFCGDFAPCRRYESLVLEKKQLIFGDLLEDIKKSDIAFVNLEVPLCVSGRKIIKNGQHLRAHPDCVDALCLAGFDVVGLANNHMMDYGSDGLDSTISICKKNGLNVVGAGNNIHKAFNPLVLERNGIKVAIIAVSEYEFSIATDTSPGVAHLNPIDVLGAIEKVRDFVDLVFVTIHGGNEYFPFPRPGLRKQCHFYINKGVDAVICHHAHVYGAYEIYRDSPIIYSLGNLIFDKINSKSGWSNGYAVALNYKINNKKLNDINIIPYNQKVSQGGVLKLSGDNLKQFNFVIENYKKILKSSTEYNKIWLNYVNDQKNKIILKNYAPLLPVFNYIAKIIPPKFLFAPNIRELSRKLNLVRCESHLELLISTLEMEMKNYEISNTSKKK